MAAKKVTITKINWGKKEFRFAFDIDGKQGTAMTLEAAKDKVKKMVNGPVEIIEKDETAKAAAPVKVKALPDAPGSSAPAKVKAKVVIEKIKKDRAPSPCGMVRSMLMEEKYTDEEIETAVLKAFPDANTKYLKSYAPKTRDLIKKFHDRTIPEYFKVGGKLTTDKPAKVKKAPVKKYTKDTDPLNTVAGLNVE